MQIFYDIINILTVTLDKSNVSLLNQIINFLKKKKMVVYIFNGWHYKNKTKQNITTTTTQKQHFFQHKIIRPLFEINQLCQSQGISLLLKNLIR